MLNMRHNYLYNCDGCYKKRDAVSDTPNLKPNNYELQIY